MQTWDGGTAANGDFSTVTSRSELRAAWQHEHSDASPIDSQFASDAGGLFNIDGQTIG